MADQNIQLIRGDIKRQKTEVAKFSVTHLDSPLRNLLPVPENEREKFYSRTDFTKDRLVLAFYEDQLVGFCTGNILTYKTYLERRVYTTVLISLS